MDPRAGAPWVADALSQISDAARVRVLAALAGDTDDLDLWWAGARNDVIEALLRSQEWASGVAVTHAAAALDDATSGAVAAGHVLAPLPPCEVATLGTADLVEHLDASPRVIASRLKSGMEMPEAVARTVEHLSGLATTEPHRIARSATAALSQSDGFDGWRRVPEATACDFCRMLGTRGAVYGSKRSAMTRASDGLRYHDHCHCSPEQITDARAARNLAERGRREWEQMSPRMRRARGRRADRQDLTLVTRGAVTPERLAAVTDLLARYEPALAKSQARAAAGGVADLEDFDRFLIAEYGALREEQAFLRVALAA